MGSAVELRTDYSASELRRLGVDYHERHVGKLLKERCFSHMSAGPRHPDQDGEIVEAYKSRHAR